MLVRKAVDPSLVSELVKSLEKVFSPRHFHEGVITLSEVAGSSSTVTGLCLLYLNAVLSLLRPQSGQCFEEVQANI